MGLPPIGTNGISSDIVQYYAPLTYQQNQKRYRDEAGQKCKPTGYPPDMSYPSDSRSDCNALTPIYRGGQNRIYEYLDKRTFHGVGTESLAYTDGTWYDWDGVTVKTPFIVNTATPAERSAFKQDWYDFIFPGSIDGNYCIRGLKQLYESVMPFEDESAPTVSEFENWNDHVLKHFRTLMSLNLCYPDQELFIHAKWAAERKSTGIWDSYSGTLDSAYGPCIPGTNIHCGETFYPELQDEQSPYWNDYYCNYPCKPQPPTFVPNSGSADLGTFWNGTAMTAMSRVIRKLVENGNTSGHAGAFCFRPYYGYYIYGTGGGGIRSKWTGTIQGPPSGFVIA